MSDGKYQKFASLAALSASSMTLRNVVLASPAGNGDVLKVKGVLKTVSGSPVLFLEYASRRAGYGRRILRRDRLKKRSCCLRSDSNGERSTMQAAVRPLWSAKKER